MPDTPIPLRYGIGMSDDIFRFLIIRIVFTASVATEEQAADTISVLVTHQQQCSNRSVVTHQLVA
ncbi:hypothetical protein J6590_075627 [Homalodisca vitripennis]|nr:hypothetical protein J6590_075627 [Homalodisca vitripennis]